METKQVQPEDLPQFRALAEAYWRELMPKSPILQNAASLEAYFDACFVWDGGNGHSWWALVKNEPIGFLSFAVNSQEKQASIDNFYIRPQSRRQGHGSAMAAWLLAHFDTCGVEQIDLNS